MYNVRMGAAFLHGSLRIGSVGRSFAHFVTVNPSVVALLVCLCVRERGERENMFACVCMCVVCVCALLVKVKDLQMKVKTKYCIFPSLTHTHSLSSLKRLDCSNIAMML